MKKKLYYSCALALNTKSLSGSVVEKIAVLFLYPSIKGEVFISISVENIGLVLVPSLMVLHTPIFENHAR